eukprot:CAMPEP_0113598130 /NCGR_PEP_ID=MMETSP0015_2-20120614/41399_1 /TAXON_ID=2838 /ORGANISM="Odontella" /LENGTH=36 /DNA_ID=CAMNT_0000506079 /DNA_START=121 /DNA_END=228 /DNA_ORIENTATION=+ /assembly_acc=CAM_ASM_000160
MPPRPYGTSSDPAADGAMDGAGVGGGRPGPVDPPES